MDPNAPAPDMQYEAATVLLEAVLDEYGGLRVEDAVWDVRTTASVLVAEFGWDEGIMADVLVDVLAGAL